MKDDRVITLHTIWSVINVESRLELALAGLEKVEIYVYTQDGKLFVEGQDRRQRDGNRICP